MASNAQKTPLREDESAVVITVHIIPACIVVLDKENAQARKGVFMIDASRGFLKNGNKNRLRERDLHQIVGVFTNAEEHAGYSWLVPHDEIEKNDFNLNLPRYIDSRAAEDIQDLGGHLHGGIPARDIDAFADYWQVCPDLRAALFQPNRPGYDNLRVEPAQFNNTIHGHPQFADFLFRLTAHFAAWNKQPAASLRAIGVNALPKLVIHELSEGLLAHAEGQPLLDAYAVYQHLMDYWATTMQDDCYIIAADGWAARTSRIVETDKKGKTKDKGWTCDLVPKGYVVARYFAKEQAAIDARQAELDATAASMVELEEEHGGEEGILGGLEKINRVEITTRLREIKGDKECKEEADVLDGWLKLDAKATELKRNLKQREAALDLLAYHKYPQLTGNEVKTLVVDDKWLTALTAAIQGELDRVSQTLTGRIRQLAERYATPLPQIADEMVALATRVDEHLKKMEAAWN